MVKCILAWSALLLLVVGELSAAVASPLITRGPYLQRASDHSIILRWRTDIASTGAVHYGTTAGQFPMAHVDTSVTTEHRIELTELQPNTKYYYRVGTDTELLSPASDDFHFQTHPSIGVARSARIWVIGDSGTGTASAASVRTGYETFSAASGAADLWLMLGDNAYDNGLDSEYQKGLFDMYPQILRNTVLWPAIGNHDGYSANSLTLTGPYYDIFSLPREGQSGGVASGTEAYYSFDYGQIHFVALDSYGVDRSTTGAMATWLRKDLAANTQRWTIAFWHHPPYSKGSHNSDTESELVQMRENLVPILEDGGVDLVLSGHSHSYERSYFIDGHYGPSTSLQNSMILDSSSGAGLGGPYSKPGDRAAHKGAVYVVAGNAAKLGSGTLNHPVMHFSSNTIYGSLILDVSVDLLQFKAINAAGAVVDSFDIAKPHVPFPTPFPNDTPTPTIPATPTPTATSPTPSVAPTQDPVGRVADTENTKRGRRIGSREALLSRDGSTEVLRCDRTRGGLRHSWTFNSVSAHARQLQLNLTAIKGLQGRLRLSGIAGVQTVRLNAGQEFRQDFALEPGVSTIVVELNLKDLAGLHGKCRVTVDQLAVR